MGKGHRICCPPFETRSFGPLLRGEVRSRESVLNFDALLNCFGTGSCMVTQVTSGLIIGMLVFLIASGVTLIFGVLKITNFAHGSPMRCTR
jgi:hypothetical protein